MSTYYDTFPPEVIDASPDLLEVKRSLNFLDIPRDDAAVHDPCRLSLYHFDTYHGPVEVLAYTEADAIRRADDMGLDVIAFWEEVCHE